MKKWWMAVFVACALAGFVPSLVGAADKATDDTKKAAAPETKKAPEKKIVDINSASEDELEALPGIGDSYAKKIKAARPYKRKDELVKRKTILQRAITKSKRQR